MLPDVLESGGISDIQMGSYRGKTVAVKTLRVGGSDDFDLMIRVRRADAPSLA